jgi:aminopeptidase N
MKYLFIFTVVAIIISCNTTHQTTKPSTQPQTSNLKPQTPQPKVYRASETKLHDLVHTKLEVQPVWEKKQMKGKATITLHPHFYSTDSVQLNARSMDIHEVSLVDEKGKRNYIDYTYDSLILNIKLGRTYKRDENFTLFIDYTAKPEELPEGGSLAIVKDKGLYFINTDGKDPDKPKQFWTQGETESNSAWFPTIDKPNQKMTQEIYLTVDTSFVTLSNGLLITSTKNNDGTRTDYWKQSLPAAPYLTMIAASNFAVVKDKWRNIEVNYYVDPEYEKYARMIFGNTPEMIEHFSKILGVDYPWEKYSQVVVHDYVSGAMENTTAVVHGTNMQQDSSEYFDDNFEDYVSHELFHHWFGDLVTSESWSNITLNEGFANYGEYIWREYKYGRDDADLLQQHDMSGYIAMSRLKDPDLIRFDYDDREDMYDVISYNKGGRVLHMLRKYVGDEAFYAALKLYLESHKFGTVEVHDLRLAFEKITGEDLNWFFSQWFLDHGYPKIDISYSWNDTSKTETVTIEQKQDFDKNPLYKIPLPVDIYYGGKKERKNITLEHAKETYTWQVPSKPDLVDVDVEKMLLCTKEDNKSKENYVFQYYHAPSYFNRQEALDKIGNDYTANSAEALLIEDALKDKFWNIRLIALKNIGPQLKENKERFRPLIIAMATKDDKSKVRAQGIKTLAKYFKDDVEAKAVIENALKEQSNLVATSAFKATYEKDKKKGLEIAKQFEASANGDLLNAVGTFYKEEGNPEYNAFFLSAIDKTKSFAKYSLIETYGRYLKKQEGKELTDGISKLTALAATASSWFMRYAGMNALEGLEGELKSRMNKATDKVEELKKTNAFQKDIQEAQHEETKIIKQHDDLEATIKDIKSNEKEKRLKKLFDSD